MTSSRLKIRLTPAAERAVRGGHPWVFADRIKFASRDGSASDLAVIYDRNDKFMAIGLFDPHSPIRIRILHMGKPVQIDDQWFSDRFAATLHRRRSLIDAPETTGYRCINGESDGWPGLVLDRYGDVGVIKLYTSSWLPLVGMLGTLAASHAETPNLVIRLSRNIQAIASKQGLADGDVLSGNVPETVTFLENGIRFEVDPIHGQKTGFFLDQRENRNRVRQLAKGARVLNVFSHSGGFSVHAAAGGARSTTDLDISAHALEAAKRNMLLNKNIEAVSQCQHTTVKADAFEWLETAPGDEKFDIVVIDPPSLAMRQSERDGALQAYRKLVTAGLNRLRNGGLMVAASCSAHVSAEDFFKAIRGVALRHQRAGHEALTTAHAEDHPAEILEAHYLKCLYWRLGNQ